MYGAPGAVSAIAGRYFKSEVNMMKKYEKNEELKKRFEDVVKDAEEGDISAMLLLARTYTESEYFPRDTIAAEAWLRKAAEFGDEEAKFQLAKLLSTGNGVAQNLEEAFNIFHELMLDCNIDAMEEVGIALKEGKGVEKDEKLGSFYIQQAFDIELDLMEDEKKKEKN